MAPWNPKGSRLHFEVAMPAVTLLAPTKVQPFGFCCSKDQRCLAGLASADTAPERAEWLAQYIRLLSRDCPNWRSTGCRTARQAIHTRSKESSRARKDHAQSGHRVPRVRRPEQTEISDSAQRLELHPCQAEQFRNLCRILPTSNGCFDFPDETQVPSRASGWRDCIRPKRGSHRRCFRMRDGRGLPPGSYSRGRHPAPFANRCSSRRRHLLDIRALFDPRVLAPPWVRYRGQREARQGQTP